jgi:hypothetical protein
MELLPSPVRPRGEPVPTGRRSLLAREKAIEAFSVAAVGGDATLAEALLESSWREAEGPDHAVERLIVTAGRAFLERRRGAVAAVRERLREAARLAADGGVDTGHYLALAHLVVHEQLIHEGRRQFISGPEPGLGAFAIVLDARRHELRAGDQVLSFRRKPVVRKLLYALAAHAGHPLTKDALARAAWGQDYNPLLHEDGLRVNIQHLRRAIERHGLSLWFDDVGYRLDVPRGFAFVETLTDPIR